MSTSTRAPLVGGQLLERGQHPLTRSPATASASGPGGPCSGQACTLPAQRAPRAAGRARPRARGAPGPGRRSPRSGAARWSPRRRPARRPRCGRPGTLRAGRPAGRPLLPRGGRGCAAPPPRAGPRCRRTGSAKGIRVAVGVGLQERGVVALPAGVRVEDLGSRPDRDVGDLAPEAPRDLRQLGQPDEQVARVRRSGRAAPCARSRRVLPGRRPCRAGRCCPGASVTPAGAAYTSKEVGAPLNRTVTDRTSWSLPRSTISPTPGLRPPSAGSPR